MTSTWKVSKRPRRCAALYAGGGVERPGFRQFAALSIGNTNMSTLLEEFRSSYSATHDAEMSLEDYLGLCKREPTAYASAALSIFQPLRT